MIPRQLTLAVSVMLLLALGMGIYTLRMRGRVKNEASSASDARPVAPPASGPTEQVILYVADDASGSLHAVPARLPLPSGRQQRAEELFRILLNMYLDKNSPHPLGPDSEVRSVFLVDPGLAVIDVSSAFAETHRSGILVEELTVLSLVQSLTANVPGITRVKILVNGKDRETLAGHVDLSGFYDVSATDQMVRQILANP